jgi:hypothetical protein
MLPRTLSNNQSRFELVISREQQAVCSSLPPTLVLLFDDVNELLDEIEDAVARPDPLP